MSYRDTTKKLAELRGEIARLRDEMRKTQRGVEPESVENYAFATTDGPVRLADLFADQDTLFVIHNMGASCRYCTLWADGFNGVLPHLESRAAFVVSSPDEPDKQQKFKDSRGWKFRMVSHHGTEFAADMGYKGDKGFHPGVSVFRKQPGKIVRVSDQGLGPYDDFCSVWHFFDMLPEGAGDWAPQYKY
ncbi:MAG TPA: DUF899 family protein [Stellaceae bacterium]|jgi:predicted dithiol-disulfide oxidoreductase (DUF899 family)|nr:DUF899 family protein [Stellaceae bacterium]